MIRFIALALVMVGSFGCAHHKNKILATNYDQFKFDPSDRTVNKKFVNKEYTDKFKSTVCGGANNKECMDKFIDMFHEKLAKRYYEATVQGAKNYCKGYPIECQDSNFLEAYYILFHNKMVDLKREYDLADAEAKDAAALRGFASSIENSNRQAQEREKEEWNRRPVKTDCYNNGSGQTRCESYK